jgi:hypothetical protein
VPFCSDPRTEPGACGDSPSGCGAGAGTPSLTGADGFLADTLGIAPDCWKPELCHITNVATAVGTTAGGETVNDDDDACLTILPYKQIGDTVWHDQNDNGVQDAGEPGIPNVKVTLTKPGGGTSTTYTDASGKYLFYDLRHGDYVVTPTMPAGFTKLTTNNAPLPVSLAPCDLVFLDADFGYWKQSCGECVGKVATLTLRYLGTRPDARILVLARDSAFGAGNVAFDGIVQPGGTFSFGPLPSPNGGFDGTLGTEIEVRIVSSAGGADAEYLESVKIHTSCSQPIGPGQIWGSFEIVAGESKLGGALCPIVR